MLLLDSNNFFLQLSGPYFSFGYLARKKKKKERLDLMEREHYAAAFAHTLAPVLEQRQWNALQTGPQPEFANITPLPIHTIRH